MRSLLIAVLLCWVGGCSAPDLKGPAEAQKKAEQERIRKATSCFAAFLDEADKAADLLASKPDADKLQDQIKKLNGLLDQATDVYPGHAKMEDVARDCKGIVRFFTVSLTNIKGSLTGKTEVSEKTKKGVYGACEANASAARQTAEIVRGKLGLTPKPDQRK